MKNTFTVLALLLMANQFNNLPSGSNSPREIVSLESNLEPNVEHVLMNKFLDRMVGTFVSQEVSNNYGISPSITRNCVRIWEKRKESTWLYLEDVLSDLPDEPFCQWIFKVTELHHDTVQINLYQLPNAQRFGLGWVNVHLFDQIRPLDLVNYNCPMLLVQGKNDKLKAKTISSCSITLGKASTIDCSMILSEDYAEFCTRGYDRNGNLVVGKEKGKHMDRFDHDENIMNAPNLSCIWSSSYGEINFKEGWYGDKSKTISGQLKFESGQFVFHGEWGRTNNDASGKFDLVFESPDRFSGSWSEGGSINSDEWKGRSKCE